MMPQSLRRALVALGIVCLLPLLPPGGASAESARDITDRCALTAASNQADLPNLLTADLGTFWQSEFFADFPMVGEDAFTSEFPIFVQVDTPPETPAYGLYVVWAYEPKGWEVAAPNPAHEKYAFLGSEDPQSVPSWAPVAQGGRQGFLHEYLALDGLTSFRIQMQRIQEQPMAIVQLRVLGEGALPDWVQTWQPIPERVDLMAISTHADDELIYFGGTLPTYAGERKLPTAVVYMTYGNRKRRSELLNGLWLAGVRSYPVLGDFIDLYTSSYAQAAVTWDEERPAAFLTEQIRRYKPKVVVSHDLNGEYGHGMHILTARKALEAVTDLAWDETCFPESAARYGVWDVDKLYLHLYPENRVTMDWRVPLAAFGGRTALEIADAAFAEHVSQYPGFRIRDTGALSCAEFGLAFTMVGPDVAKNDFFENVTLWEEEDAP
jgi:LmbE family N-acetylglucosaminyl deacetylase